ncbi:hypothetical protein [Rhodopseudomonas faecalis]|uniref:hypothetical protein n=1 Tax=Rhodopseudomonas faecalis TaxID=99655 RepID=UPI000DA240D5|nr:hypothetical protein [Rhodopseudomonas faecalis]
MLGRIGLEKHDVGVGDDVLWLKGEGHEIAEARPRLEVRIRLWLEIEVGETREPVEHRFDNLRGSPFVLDVCRDFDLGPLDHHHVAGALLVAGFAPGQQLLPLDRVDEHAEPATILSDNTDRDGAFIGRQAVIDNGDHGGLAGLRRAANNVHDARVELDNAWLAVVPGPEDEFAQLKIH